MTTPAPVVAQAEPAAAAAAGRRSRPRRPSSKPVAGFTRRAEAGDRADHQETTSSPIPRSSSTCRPRSKRRWRRSRPRSSRSPSPRTPREIYREPDASVAGNPDGDITVVEFFDYNCGYCKRGLHDVDQAGRDRPQGARRVQGAADPVEGLGGSLARRARRPQAGQVLGDPQGHARGQGPDERGRRAADRREARPRHGQAEEPTWPRPRSKAEIEKSEALAKKMGVNGTPHFLVGDRAIPGAPEDLYDQLDEARRRSCASRAAPTADAPQLAARTAPMLRLQRGRRSRLFPRHARGGLPQVRES